MTARLVQGGGPPILSPREIKHVRERLRRCAEVSGFCMMLRHAVRHGTALHGATPDLLRMAARLAEALGPDDCVIVGALAVAAHGYPHATDEVDLLTRLDLKDAQKRLREHGIETTV